VATPDAVEAEALGLDSVTATFAGRGWRVGLDVETWPLAVIRRCVGMSSIQVDQMAIADALEQILGNQWDDFVALAPKARNLAPMSNAVAKAAGFESREPIDKAFGAIPRLLAVLDSWPSAVESDLNQFWHIDYRDRFIIENGRRKLTLRQIGARVDHLPVGSALAVEMGRRSPTDLLLMDLCEPLAGKPHPARPLTREQIAERRAAEESDRKAREAYEARRIAQGHRRVETGLAKARENASRGRL